MRYVSIGVPLLKSNIAEISSISYHGTITVTIYGYILTDIIFEKHSTIPQTKPKCCLNSTVFACLHNNWARYETRIWTKFGWNTSGFLEPFQEPIVLSRAVFCMLSIQYFYVKWAKSIHTSVRIAINGTKSLNGLHVHSLLYFLHCVLDVVY